MGQTIEELEREYAAAKAADEAARKVRAAAPDMLVALQMSLPALEWCQQRWANSPQHGEGINVLDVVRAAILKATT